jgi:hypothetical protein
MKFKAGEHGSPKTELKPGNPHRWQRGQSGNPAGRSKAKVQFDRMLADALMSPDPEARAQELSDLIWKAARDGEPWAVQLLFQRLAPQPLNVRMEVEKHGDEIDFSKFTDEELEQFGRILERIEGQTGLLESGESTPESE